MFKFLVTISFLVLWTASGFAQRVEVGSENTERSSDWRGRAKKIPTGRAAASKYMNRKVAGVDGGSRYLALHIGGFANSQAYRWGEQDSWNDKAKTNLGVTYRVGEWSQSMDNFFRAELLSYSFDDKKPLKLSFMPIISFPDSRSRFPLYFGAGVGGGVFLKQVSGESSISLDYALVIGARFFDVFESAGLLFETGLKGHVHLLSSGQFNSTYVSAGTVFAF
ncbi:MAG: hypothetical protein VX642_07830 [Bdellovibrionota bacterium]|nr:hypothetical protein [Bdellovibrionota bacterium]